MIHYHGLPIHPDHACSAIIHAGHAMVSFAHPEQLGLAAEVCQSFVLDNGAFSAWKSGDPIQDWEPYLDWALEAFYHPGCDWVTIPDVIDGDEHANDSLVHWFVGRWRCFRKDASSACVPVWHMHESFGRLQRLAAVFSRVAIGSSGKFADIGTSDWWQQITGAIRSISDNGRPRVKLHGMRMLDVNVFTRLPLSSADSTNIARNVGIDKRWTGSYRPPTKTARGQILRQRIESVNSSDVLLECETANQSDLFEC